MPAEATNGIAVAAGANHSLALTKRTGLSITVPVVQLTSPADGSKVNANTDVTLTASAKDADGIRRVVFYSQVVPYRVIDWQRPVMIGESAREPYQVIWSKPASGRYTLWAEVVDFMDTKGTSPTIQIGVGSSTNR